MSAEGLSYVLGEGWAQPGDQGSSLYFRIRPHTSPFGSSLVISCWYTVHTRICTRSINLSVAGLGHTFILGLGWIKYTDHCVRYGEVVLFYILLIGRLKNWGSSGDGGDFFFILGNGRGYFSLKLQFLQFLKFSSRFLFMGLIFLWLNIERCL